MKLCDSLVLNNLAMFDQRNINSVKIANPVKFLMRGLVDTFLIWKTIEYFKSTTLLEIGSYAGQTLGLMCESAGKDSKIISVDIDLQNLQVFQHLFPDNHVEFHQIDSLDMSFDQPFDFIHVDGNHFNPWVENDVIKSLAMSTPNTIISLDDHEKSRFDVDTVIKKYLLGQHNFVPFLEGDSSIFFHHVSHDANEFLDQWLQKDANNFLTFSNKNYFYDYQVLKTSFVSQYSLSSDLPGLFQDSLDLFKKSLKFYNL